MPAQRLADAKSFDRYAFARTLDSTERIAQVIAGFAPYRRPTTPTNAFYRTLDSLSPEDVQGAARKYFTDAGMIVTTLAKEPLPPAIEKAPALASITPAAAVDSRRRQLPPSRRRACRHSRAGAATCA